MGKFWMLDDFVRIHSRKVKPREQAIYMALSSHANKQNETFVSTRTIGKELNINKDTVVRGLKKLIKEGFIERTDKKVRNASVIRLLCVPKWKPKLSENFRHKEYNKELFKEKKRFYKKSEPESIGNILDKRKSKYGLNELKKDVRSGNVFRKKKI